MTDSPYLEPQHHGESHSRRHKRKRKSRRKQIWQRIIVIGLFILVCAGALAAWHFLVQEPAPRTSGPDRDTPHLQKA